MDGKSEYVDEQVWLQLTYERLDVLRATQFLQNPHSGGINLFLGTTRQWTQDRETSLLSYEAYVPMALKEMERLVGVVLERWMARRIVVLHRLGEVPISEASVLIGVASPHRSASFEATRYLIDTLKEQVPIWKKETFADGTKEWITGATMPTVHPPK